MLHYLEDAICSDILSRYADTGIYSVSFPNLFVLRFNEYKLLQRQYRNPQFVVFVFKGQVSGICGSKANTASAGDSYAANIYVSSVLEVEGPPTPDNPAVFLNIPLHRPYMTEVLSRSRLAPKAKQSTLNQTHAGHYSVEELLAVKQLLDVLFADSPHDEPHDYALEIALKALYLALLNGEHGTFIRESFSSQPHHGKLLEVISYIGQHYREELNAEKLASMACMSVSNFYRYFKDVTSITPQQYVKRLRLYEARRLLLTEKQSVSEASFRVGYPSRGIFSLDYKKLFGHPPSLDCYHDPHNKKDPL